MPKPAEMDLEELEKLVAEMLGTELDEVSVVDHPATDRAFRLFKRAPVDGAPRRGDMPGAKGDTARLGALLKTLSKAVPEGRDRETFDRCVEHIVERIESGELSPADPAADPKSVGFAMCTASGAGKAAKDGELPPAPGSEVPPPGEEPPPDAGGDTVEIPATPEKWTFADCITDAMDLGFKEDSAIAVCQVVRQSYGDPEDPETIYVPDNSSTAGVLADAAVFGGVAMPEGLKPSPPEQAMRFSGKNQWLRKFRRFLGVDRPPTKAQLDEARIKKEVRRLMADQAKTKEDLKETIGLLRDVLFATLRAQGIELPPAALAGVMPPAAAAETRAEGGTAVAEAIAPAASDDPAKRVKDLEAEVARLAALIEKGAKSAPAGEGEPDEPDASDARIVPNARTAPALYEVPVMRKSVDPRGGKGRTAADAEAEHYSTYLNAKVPREDWEALGPRRQAAR